jgi:ribonuclease BN (tRNA processing enzyme)
MFIHLLGTGNPNADPERSGPAVAIRIGERIYVIDCGPGVIRRAAAANLKIEALSNLLITHLHSDHTVGLPDFIFTPWVLGRNQPLKIYGPKGINKMVYNIQKAYQQDIEDRITGLPPINSEGYKADVKEIESGIVYMDNELQIEAFNMKHGILSSYGYKFITSERTVAISGDTKAFSDLVSFYNGCDVLLHEVYSVQGFAELSTEWQEYHSNYHTSSHELAEIAREVRPKLLILYHQINWNAPQTSCLEEVCQNYAGAVVIGRDLDVY